MSESITIEQLRDQFVGKMVKITHTGNVPHKLREAVTKKCVAIHLIPGETDEHVDIELDDGHRYGFTPQTLTDRYVEGEVSRHHVFRRSMELATNE